ncbi:MAG TPA: hypothetical protein VFX35_11900 [Solirubrobacterales bacterium]|nr:hypothetical protein [Solirubrobacterales bacterium]
MEIEEAAALGAENQKIIDLVERHCRNARVEKSPHFGEGLVEAMSGLPVGGREIKCPHAANPSMAGMQLEGIAVSFYRQNCVGCPHREVVSIPNLKTFVDDLDRATEENARKKKAEAEKRAAEQAARAEARRHLVENDPQPVREWIGLIDGIDVDEPDERAQQFLDIARGGAELCTAGAEGAIVEAALASPGRELCEAVDALNDAGRVLDSRALEVALSALAKGPNKSAVRVVIRLKDRLESEDLVPCMAAAILLAGPQRDIPFESKPPDTRLLKLAAERNLPALLDQLVKMLGRDGSWRRGAAGAAAARLIEIEPGSAEILAAALIDALSLPESTSIYAGSPRSGISSGLEAALIAKPHEVSGLYLKRGAGLEEEQREMLFHAFDAVIRTRMSEDSVPMPAGEIAIDSLLEIAGGTFGEKPANAAASSLELAANYHPELLIERPASLIGVLMKAVSTPVSIEEGIPPQLTGMVQQTQEMIRRGRISHLTAALGRLAAYRAEAVSPELFALLDGEDPPGDAARDLRAELTRTLGSIGVHPELRQGVLQRLYGALLSPEVAVRAAAIGAWEELARAPHFEAPPELEELIIPLLTDTYVAVHLAMVNGLRHRISIPGRHREQVVLILMELTKLYAERDDSQAFESILETTWSCCAVLPHPVRHGVRRQLLVFAARLQPHALERLVMRVNGEEFLLDEYADRLLQAVHGTETTIDQRGDELMRRLRDLPASALKNRAESVVEAARVRLPQWTGEAAEFVEVLQGAGLWNEAVTLAEEIAVGVPDDAEHAAQRAGVLARLGQARFEAALVDGDFARAEHELARWHEHVEREQEVREARASPFDLPLEEPSDD